MTRISVSQIAELCGVATRTVKKRCESLRSWPGDKNSICYESTEALPRVLGVALDDDEGGDAFTRERTRLTKAQADKTELEVKVLRADLIPAAIVERVQGTIMSNIRARMLSIPIKAAPMVLGARSEVAAQTILTDMVHDALTELAEFNESDYLSQDQRTAAASAEVDAEPVGRQRASAEPRRQRRAGPVEH